MATRSIFALTLMCALAACGSDTITGPTAAIPAHEVLLAITVPGACLTGVCVPPSSDVNTIAQVTITNSGTAAVYLHSCGGQISIVEQEFGGGVWENIGPAVTCTDDATPTILAAGGSLQLNWYFASGRRRLVLGVGTTPALSDEALSVSASADIP
jgi:hypothetical protein